MALAFLRIKICSTVDKEKVIFSFWLDKWKNCNDDRTEEWRNRCWKGTAQSGKIGITHTAVRFLLLTAVILFKKGLSHHFYKAEHFIRSLVWIVLLGINHRLARLKIFTPKLIDLETALVDVEMDIALFKIGGTGFPYLGFGVQSLNSKPCALADSFTMCLG